jgi:NDP-sugar pyrophosphorylase family protein
MAENPRHVAAWISDASFLDIGTPADCLETSLTLAAREGDRLVGARAKVASTAVVERSVLWDDVTIDAGATLRECIVGDRVRIPQGAQFERCAIVNAGSRMPTPFEWAIDGLIVRDLGIHA